MGGIEKKIKILNVIVYNLKNQSKEERIHDHDSWILGERETIEY